MYCLKYSLRCLIIVLLAAPAAVFANSWSCTNGDHVREVVVEYDGSDPVPCIVVYKKTTEGVADQTLWSAEGQAGYCEEKAAAFVAKQESWGWACTKAVAEKMESETMEGGKMETPEAGGGEMEGSESGAGTTGAEGMGDAMGQ